MWHRPCSFSKSLPKGTNIVLGSTHSYCSDKCTKSKILNVECDFRLSFNAEQSQEQIFQRIVKLIDHKLSQPMIIENVLEHTAKEFCSQVTKHHHRQQREHYDMS